MRMTVQQWLNTPNVSGLFLPFSPTGDITCGLVRYDSGARMFRIYAGSEYHQSYDMEADRILSGAGFLDFLLQIHTKEWVTGQHLKDLLDCVTCWIYRDHGERFPQEFFSVIHGMNKGLDDAGKI